MVKAPVSDTKAFGDTAKALARNPLGIIALFIVLVYGFACLVTAFSSTFTDAQKTPLVYFLVIFPVLVLGVFAWLVSRHSGKLFAPSDYKDEANYVKMQLSAVASLAVASVKNPSTTAGSESEIQQIVDVVQYATPTAASYAPEWRNRILWVDDIPKNNIHERKAFEAIGIRFVLALSTGEALDKLSMDKFAAIISDMGREEGPREGYALLDAIRKNGDQTPFFIYAGSNAPEHKAETIKHGGQGCTNNAQELFQMVTRAVLDLS